MYTIKKELPNIIFKYCTSIHADAQSFRFLRTGHNCPTVWQSYLAVVATLFVYNTNKASPVRYHPPHANKVACIEYDNMDLYNETMKINTKDLDL